MNCNRSRGLSPFARVNGYGPSHRKDKIHKFGHMHSDDVVQRRARFKNQLVIASHFSTRYHERQIQHWIAKGLPDMLDGRLKLWI